MKREALELAVADSLIAGHRNPVILSAFTKPDFVRQAALLEVIRVAHNGRASVAQRGRDREAVERLVEEEGKRVRPP